MSTTTEENKILVRRYLDALSGHDKPAAIVNQFVADSDDALKQHIAEAEVAFPHYALVPDDLIAEGDKVMVRFTLKGTHRGPFMGIPATNKEVSVPGFIVYQIANSKIVQHWMLTDSMVMMQQLGVMPAAASA